MAEESEATLEIKPNVTLAPFTSWMIGGPAEYFAQPTSLPELQYAMDWASKKNLNVTVLSGGSNVLISDKGVRGLVINMGKFTGVFAKEADGRLVITCLSGTPKSELLKLFLRHKLEPALFLAGIPGDVGGGVVMNAGVSEALRPREFVEIVDWIRVLRGPSVITLTRDQLNWSYRHCEGWRPGVIVEVCVSWPLQPQPDILPKVKEANTNRLKRQPLDKPSCGSVFVNPDGGKAGQLIESSGLKGYRVGDAQVSEKHANFIVNLGQAKAQDVRNVIEHVQATVKKQTGFTLKTEVIFIGDVS
jgi:UDP-N-acetylmuramate dehydrogenase